MEPTDIRFGGGASQTTLHPVIAVILCVSIVLTLVLPRRYVLVSWLLTVLLIPFGQVLVVGGVHFTVYRIAVLCGLARMAITKSSARQGRFPGGFTIIDGAFCLCALLSFVAFTLQWMEWQALIKGLGNLLDALGGYCVVRQLICGEEDVQRLWKVLAFIATAVALCMINEQLTHSNLYGLLGGVPLDVPIRDGHARAMGPFEVYLTAGVFGATLCPLFILVCSQVNGRLIGLLGFAAATVITFTSNTSTSLLAYVSGLAALCFWPLRKRMRAFRWGLALLLVSLHLFMKAPIWALIGRIDLTGSSSGFHRYMLVDQCIRHIGDWWLIGAKNYNDWGSDLWDLSNQYVAYAVTGGLATLMAFVFIICCSFGRLGTVRTLVSGHRRLEWRLWCLCAALLAHVVAYLGVSYFDQMQVAWYVMLAIIVVSTSELAHSPLQQIDKRPVLADQPSGAMTTHPSW